MQHASPPHTAHVQCSSLITMSSSRRDGRLSRDSSTKSAESAQRLSTGNILRSMNKSTTSRNSQASSAAERKRASTFVRTFFAQRNNDYRPDVPTSTPVYSQGTVRTTMRSSGRSSPPPPETTASEHEEKSTRSSVEFLRPSPAFLNVLSNIIGSRLWRVTIAFNTFLLLFGSEVQEIWIPPAGDTAMDVLYCIALAVFTMDMVMRCYLEPKYMNVPRCRAKESAQSKAWGRCQMGSFLFWCDLLSTLTLLYNVSFINTELNDMLTYDIELNQIGLPEQGLDEINAAVPVTLNYDVLILIGRTARAARLIQQITFKRSNSKFNSYWFVTRLNPVWHMGKYRQRRRRSRTLSLLKSTAVDSSPDSNIQSSERLQRSTSWGALQMAIMAKTRSYPTETEKPRGIKGMTVHALRKMGIMRNNKHEEFRRQMAATKIQRAWRATVANPEGVARDDVAWLGQRGSLRSTSPPNNKKMHIWERRRAPEDSTSGKGSLQTAIRGGRRPESQVGSAMRELTAQRVALGIIIALILTVLFTYTENDATRPSAMIVLHNQTANEDYATASLQAARNSSIPDLYEYVFANGEIVTFPVPESQNPDNLRNREKMRITVAKVYKNGTADIIGNKTIGYFAYREERENQAWVQVCTTLFILFIWLFGVTAFAGPVMTLVVIPIERMVRLLGMLMMDPLGYQSTSRYKKFVAEEDEVTKYTQWTKEQLKGMET